MKVVNTYVSEQLGHDDSGNIVEPGNMEAQMRHAYANIRKVLSQYGATVDNIVDETLFVTDMNTAFAAAEKCREDVFFGTPIVATTIVHFQRLTFPRLMIGIKCIAKV